MSLYSRLDRLAADVEKLNRQVTAVANSPQSQRTSVEGGSIDFNDADGNLMAVVGGQDDGSNTIRHIDGPTPPIPSGLSAHVDGPIVQVSWDGTFESSITHDWHYLEVLAVGPNNEQLTGTINDLSGGETSLAATAQGDWVIVARSVSRAGKRSLDGDAGTAQVKLVGLTGALEAVQESADGKNTIYYSATMPPGVEYTTGDLWFDTSEAGQNEVHVWDGGQWMSLADARVDVLEAAQVSLGTAMSELDGRLGTVETDLPQQIADAKQAAIDAAALDATDKADAAQLAAEAKAATAQQAADSALAAINAGDSMWADPGFESGSGPFASLRPEATRSTEFAYQGAWSMKIVTDGDAGNQYPDMVYADVTPGRTYRLSVAVRSEDSITFESWFHEYDDETLVGAVPYLQVPTTPGSWRLGNVIRTVPSGVNRFRFIPMIRGVDNTVAGRALFMDNFTLTDITDGYEQYLEALQAAQDAQTVAGEAKAIAEAAVGAAEGGNTNFFSMSEPAGVGSLVGDRWFKRDAAWAITGLWMWDGSVWVKQTLNNEVIGNLDAGKITFGKMNGERIDVGTIYADRIVSGVSQNMVPDPGFSNATISAHRIAKANTYGAVVTIDNGVLGIDATPGITASPNVSLAATDDLYAWAAYPAMRVAAKVSARGVGAFRLNMRYKKRDGSTVYTTLNPTTYTPLTSTWADYSYTYDLPQDAVGFSVVIQLQSSSTGLCEFRSPLVAAQVGSTVIENGSVTTGKLQADVLNVSNLKAGTAAIDEAVANKLFAEAVVAKMVTAEEFIGENAILTGAVTADKMAVGSITAESGVIASLDLGTATVGELDGIRIMGQTVRGEQLSGDAIDGKVITGGTYRTTGGTGSWSDAGLFIAQPDGTSMVRFPTDGSPLSLTASDTQIERASITDLDLSYGAVRSGGELTLASGVTAPASPPELTTGWQKTAVLDRPTYSTSYNWTGLASWGDKWVRVLNSWGEAGDSQDLVLIYNGDGTVNKKISVGLNPRQGLTVMGDIVYVFGAGHGGTSDRNFIDGYDLNTGERVSRHEYTRGIQAVNALGNDGTNLIIGSVYNLELWVHRRNPTTGVQVGSDMRSGSNSWPASGGKDLFGVRISGNDVEVVTSWGGRVYLNSNNALVRKADSANASGYAGWVLPAHDVSGCAWIDSAPYPVDSGGSVYQGSASASDYTSELCFTWYDGTHETTASPVAATGVGARETVTVSLPTRAGLQKRLYARAQGGTNWARSTAAADATTAPVPVGVPSFAPPTTNSFPNADPAVFRSTNGNVVVRGDGSGKWGPLTFNADGTMTSSQIPEWVPVTTFATGFGPHTWGDVPSYRIWPDGKVEWRGVIAGTMPVEEAVPVFTIPAAARPGRPKNKTAAATGGGVLRVEFGPLSNSADFLVFPDMVKGTRTWVSIDELYYYLP